MNQPIRNSQPCFSIYTLIITMCLLLTQSAIFAGQYHWTGELDNNWHNPVNWMEGQIPGANDDVNIPENENGVYPFIHTDIQITALSIDQNAGVTLAYKSIVQVKKLDNSGTVNGEGNLFVYECLNNYGLVSGTTVSVYSNCLHNEGYMNDDSPFSALSASIADELLDNATIHSKEHK